MAKGFAVRGRGTSRRYAARLDQGERAVLVELMGQVLELLQPGASVLPEEPEPPPRSPAGEAPEDDFDAIVAGLGSRFGGIPESGVDDDGLGGRGFGGSARDPAMDRLFPAGHRSDEAVAAEFRRLTEDGLRQRKVDNLRTAIAALTREDDRVELAGPAATAFLVALTDVRLVIGDRLGLRDDEDAQRLDAVAALADPEDPAAYAIVLYDFLTWLQETLATSMLAASGR